MEKKKTDKLPICAICPLRAPAELEKLNRIWRDFRKVVQFIDDNRVWLLPLLERVKS